MSDLTEIQSFYKGKTIFITGGTGFMGKVLIEKLLFSCSELDKIYVLIRSKRGRAPNIRLDEMFQLPVSVICHRGACVYSRRLLLSYCSLFDERLTFFGRIRVLLSKRISLRSNPER